MKNVQKHVLQCTLSLSKSLSHSHRGNIFICVYFFLLMKPFFETKITLTLSKPNEYLVIEVSARLSTVLWDKGLPIMQWPGNGLTSDRMIKMKGKMSKSSNKRKNEIYFKWHLWLRIENIAFTHDNWNISNKSLFLRYISFQKMNNS